MSLSLKKLPIIARRLIMNQLMGTGWYPRLRYRFRRRASTGTGAMRGGEFATHVTYNFAAYRKHLAGRVDGFDGLRVLEIGPGEHLGVALLFIAAGARQVVSIDCAREVRNQSPEIAEMYRELAARLPSGLSAEIYRRGLDSLVDCENRGNSVFYRPYLSMEQAVSRDLGEFDLIVSTSVLEHVHDLAAGFRSMASLLRPGGWIAHSVDLASHDRYETYPLEFLETGSLLWDLQFRNLGGPNRHRAPEYRKFLGEAGFGDIEVRTDQEFPAEALARVRGRLAEPFRGLSDSDLRPSVIFVCGRKRPSVR